jgi:hypothetical protein
VHGLTRIGKGVKVIRARKVGLKVCKVQSDRYELMVRDALHGWSRIGSTVICLYLSIDQNRKTPQDVLFWTNWPLPSMCERDEVLHMMREHAIPMKRHNYIQLAYWGGVPDPWRAEHEARLPVELQGLERCTVGRAERTRDRVNAQTDRTRTQNAPAEC